MTPCIPSRCFMSPKRGFLFSENRVCPFWDMRCRCFMSFKRGFLFLENRVCPFWDLFIHNSWFIIIGAALIVTTWIVVVKFVPWIVIRFIRCFLPPGNAVCRGKCHLPAKREYHCCTSIRPWKRVNDCNSAGHLNVALFSANEFGCNRHWQWFNGFAGRFYLGTTRGARIFFLQGCQQTRQAEFVSAFRDCNIFGSRNLQTYSANVCLGWSWSGTRIGRCLRLMP